MGIALLESILPGARSLRPPLIAGLLWSLFLWLLFADSIPERAEADGWSAQAYNLADALGPVTLGIVASVLIFIVGAVFTSAADFFIEVLGKGAEVARRRWEWQSHAQRARRQLRRRWAEVNRKLTALQTLPENETFEGMAPEAARVRLTNEQLRLQDQVKGLPSGPRHAFVRDRPETRRLLGNPPARADGGLEEEMIAQARRRAAEDAIQAQDVSAPVSEVVQEDWHRNSVLAEKLLRDLRTDPLDALRMDETLFLELDRERAEREVRLGLAVPVMALGIQGAVRWSEVWLLLALLALIALVRHSLARSDERSRVLNLLNLRNMLTPALREAEAQGRDDVRAYRRKLVQQAEKRERAEQEARQRQESAAPLQAAPT